MKCDFCPNDDATHRQFPPEDGEMHYLCDACWSIGLMTIVGHANRVSNTDFLIGLGYDHNDWDDS